MINEAHYASRQNCLIMQLQPLLNSPHSAIDRATVWCRNTIFEISSLSVTEAYASHSVQLESHQQEVYAALQKNSGTTRSRGYSQSKFVSHHDSSNSIPRVPQEVKIL